MEKCSGLLHLLASHSSAVLQLFPLLTKTAVERLVARAIKFSCVQPRNGTGSIPAMQWLSQIAFSIPTHTISLRDWILWSFWLCGRQTPGLVTQNSGPCRLVTSGLVLAASQAPCIVVVEIIFKGCKWPYLQGYSLSFALMNAIPQEDRDSSSLLQSIIKVFVITKDYNTDSKLPTRRLNTSRLPLKSQTSFL